MTFSVTDFKPHRDKVFVTELESGPRKTNSGIILPDDDMTERGIRERWGRVWAVGANIDEVEPGDWVLVKHGRWSLGIDLETPEGAVRIWHVDYPDAVLVATKDDPRQTHKTAL